MKLKTLKDIEEEAFNDGQEISIFYLQKLKAEAIKWVKEEREYIVKHPLNFVMEFLNITEEDLQ